MRRFVTAALLTATATATAAAGTAAPPAAAQIVTEADGTRTLVTEDVIPAAPHAVWHAVSTAKGWTEWAVPAAWMVAPDLLETSYEPGAAPGGADNIQHRILARLPGRLLVLRNAKTPANFPHAAALADTTLFLELIPDGAGTRLRLTGTGYPAGAEGDMLLRFFEAGNRMTIEQLVGRFRLAPLEFLAGHCWQGTLPTGERNVHCFAWDGGKLRERHEVLRAGKPVYGGETLYRWDAAAGAIAFAYSSGGRPVGAGQVRAIPGGLDFGTADYASGDTTVSIATRWLRIGDDGYEAVDSSAAKAFDHRVRYTRVD